MLLQTLKCILAFNLMTAVALAEESAAPEEKKAVTQEWVSLQNDLNTLKAKIKSKQDIIMKILEQKKQGGAASVGASSEALIAEYKELQVISQEYEKKRTVLMFRYPEKGKDPDRKYNRLQIKSLEEMEAQAGVDAQLDLNMAIMKKQYPGRKSVTPVPDESKKKEKVLKENTIESETIILSK